MKEQYDQQFIREEFESKLAEVLSRISAITRAKIDPALPSETSGDSADQAWDSQHTTSTEYLNRELRFTSAEVRSALARIENGSFGICQNCDDPIPMSRLRIRPSAPYCIECQSELENERRKLAS